VPAAPLLVLFGKRGKAGAGEFVRDPAAQVRRPDEPAGQEQGQTEQGGEEPTGPRVPAVECDGLAGQVDGDRDDGDERERDDPARVSSVLLRN
jgi:hypothetical protein